MSKGSNQRPSQVSAEQYRQNWERTFLGPEIVESIALGTARWRQWSEVNEATNTIDIHSALEYDVPEANAE